ncbi:MAG: hypothetical protein WC657_07660 [Candidatus Paceibacterota bacterium]|jgi:hypothetical protein
MGYKIVKVFHADHGVDESTMLGALEEIKPQGFFKRTVTLPADHADLTNNLYGPDAGDPPVKGESLVRDAGDEYRGATPFVNLPPRPTRLLTMIGMAEGEDVTVFTAYGGPAAERIPSDPSLAEDPDGKAAAEAFWGQHALSIAAKK